MSIFDEIAKVNQLKLGKKIDTLLTSETLVEKKDHLSASELSKCLRCLVYGRIISHKEKIGGRLQRIFDVGNAVHERYYSYFKKLGILIDKEIRFSVNGIHGVIDAIFDGESYIVAELKSMNHNQFNALQFPGEGYLSQLLIYLVIVEKTFQEIQKGKPERNEALTDVLLKLSLKPVRGLLLYEDKDTQAIKEFEIELKGENREKAEYLFRVPSIVENFLKAGILPERKCTSEVDKEGRYCPFRDICFRNLTFKEVEDGRS